MNERRWVEKVAQGLSGLRLHSNRRMEIRTGLRLAYGYEIASYGDSVDSRSSGFETDLAIVEDLGEGRWKPRVIVEAKVNSINTHDAITYSHKAAIHKAVHPYLRYGVMMGNRQRLALPGRLFRHGAHFDFMVAFKRYSASPAERRSFLKLLRSEIEASLLLENLFYDSRKQGRDRYTLLQRRLVLE